ncbi:hypothetical protein SAMD00019534_032190 [Acytostelium subglobosum LB1]|uniref:hypothetical protein n=1 Tax=Acytostelium subglobosum LB1 TaxID=1410327 RepID=UPI000644E3EB|nr:hypothetical protein SAMD00019534_032190 [Acytostelium subglobosum LB1]GAM20044.1 hypothetical protein SAMD00019534_032190 [Acytostelium subglobosum LB1]|eukprot:XP_012756806.1 hypothetical protein SAMD00019534_032190 [Acytostelium subglobosum LB1]
MVKVNFSTLSKSAKKFAKEKETEIKGQIMEDPFSLVPVDAVIGLVKDPVGFLSEKFNDKEFLGECIATALSCVPYVGPILSTVFSMFWPKDPNAAVITKGELEARLTEFRTEMEKVIDTKIDAAITESESSMWKSLVAAFFETLIDRVEDAKDLVNCLKRGLLDDAEGCDKIKTDVRVAMEQIRQKAKELSNFCRNPKFAKHVLKYHYHVMFILVATHRQMDAFWYQFDIDPRFVMGAPAIPKHNLKEIRSLAEKLHVYISNAMGAIAKGVMDNVKDKKTDRNSCYDEYSAKLFLSDMYLYPCPLFIAPASTSDTITVPDKGSKFIYRIDAANFKARYPSSRDWKDAAQVDVLTGCKGMILGEGPSITLKLAKKCNVRVRVFGQYTKDITLLDLGYDKVIPTVSDSMPAPSLFKIPSGFDNFDWLITGFAKMDRLTNIDTLNLTFSMDPEEAMHRMEGDSMVKAGNGCVKFVELIITSI